MRLHRKFGLVVGFAAAVLAIGVTSAAGGSAAPQAQPIGDAQLKALTTTIDGGAKVLPTTRTVTHWFGSTLNPDDGVTYGYNMVGADPNTCAGSACSATIEADITPIIVNVGGLTFSGEDVLPATLASPQFALNDYGSTPFATAAGARSPMPPRSSRALAAFSRRVTRAISSSSRTRRCGRSST